MNKKLQFKTFLIIAFCSLLSVQLNAQNHDQTFSTNASFQYYNIGYGNGTRSHDSTGGLTGDGAFKLVRDNNNNSNFGFNDGIDALTKKVIKLRYKNETTAPNIQIKGKSNDGTTETDLGTTIVGIDSNSSDWKTIYIDMSGVAAWTNDVDNLDILVKGSASVPATGDAVGSAFFLDEITFLNAMPADEFSEFIPNPSFEDTTEDSNYTGALDDGIRSFENLADAKDGVGVLKYEYSQDQTKTQYTFNTFQKEYSPSSFPIGTKLQVKMWVKTNRSEVTKLSVRFNTRLNGANTNITETLTTTKTDGSWEELTFDVTATAVFNQMRFWFAIEYNSGAATDFNSGDILYLDKLSSGVFPVTTAATPGTWEASGSWGGTLPVQGDSKTVDADISINSAVVSDGPIDITTGNTLTIKAGHSLTLNSDINIDGTLNLEAGAQLIVKGNSTGNASFVRTLPALTSDGADAGLEGWFSITAPFSGAALNTTWANDGTNNIATSADTNKRGIAWYTESSDAFTYLLSDNSNATTFEAGKGYIVKQTSAGNISFTGTINSSVDGVDVLVTKAGNGFNLLGSPYSALVNSGTFLTDTDNSGLFASSEIWVWNDDGNTYESKPSGDNFMLAPGQAFFVQVNAGGTLNFKQSNQSIGGDTFQKSSKTEIILKVNNGKTHRYAKVNYLNNSTLGYDNGYEGKVFEGIPNSFSVYTHLLENNESKKYQIQSLPSSNIESMVIPVGIDVAESSEITFTLEAKNIPSGLKVFLEDRQENTFTQLDVLNSEYKVSLTEVSNGIGRFYLHTRASALSTDDVFLNSVSIFKSDGSTLKVVGLKNGKASISIFNILGKQVMSTSFTANGVKEIALPNVAKGVYLVQLTTESGKLNKKIILE